MPVDLVKCDAEGAELKVIQGAARCLSSRHPPVLLLELGPWSTALWGYAPEELVTAVLHGCPEYAPFWVHSQTGLLNPLPDHIGFRLNAVFVPRWALERLQGNETVGTQEASPPSS